MAAENQMSAAMLEQSARGLASAAASRLLDGNPDLAAVRPARSVKPDIKILVGGPLLASVPSVWREIGADAGAASAEEAIQVAAALVGID